MSGLALALTNKFGSAASIKKFTSGLKHVSDKSRISWWQVSDKLPAREKSRT